MADYSILAAFGHPDDEQGITGALAMARDKGYRTGLICATRGEMGEISDPALATPQNLGTVRELEMRRAMAEVGLGRLWFLDYRDSGMAGTDANSDSRAFVNAPEDEAVGKLVGIIREFKPTIIITWDKTGGYGHPDHITAHHRVTAAFHAAADPSRYPDVGEAWQTYRLYYTGISRSAVLQFAQMLEKAGQPSPFGDVNPNEMGIPDEEIVKHLDVMQYVDVKNASFAHHRTQINPNSPFAEMPPEAEREWRGNEMFAFGGGAAVQPDEDRSDLYAGA